jgi:hypothetical protein
LQFKIPDGVGHVASKKFVSRLKPPSILKKSYEEDISTNKQLAPQRVLAPDSKKRLKMPQFTESCSMIGFGTQATTIPLQNKQKRKKIESGDVG